MERTIITGGHVITMDPDLGEIPGGDVLIEGGRIAAVARRIDAPGARTVDARGHAVLPGLVDSHRHLWQSPLRGIGADLTLGAYLGEVLGGIGPRYRPDDMLTASLLGSVEALDTGVTTVFDWCNATASPEHADAAVEGLVAAGIRAVFGHGNPDDETDVARLAGRAGLVTTAVATLGPEYMDFAGAARHIALAREYGLVASMHLGAGDLGATARSVSRLGDAGLLGPDLQFVHANTIGDDEVEAVIHSGAGVTVTPMVECLMGHGRPAYGRFADAGGTPALGVDVVVNAAADLFGQLRLTLAQERLRTRRPVPAKDLLASVTIDGARAIGLGDRIGSLTVGKRADVLVVDGVAAVPADRVASAVAATAGPANVRTVLIDGSVVKHQGHLVGHDLPALRDAGDRLARRLLSGAGA